MAPTARTSYQRSLTTAVRSAWWALPLLALCVASITFVIGILLVPETFLLPAAAMAGARRPITAVGRLRRHLVWQYGVRLLGRRYGVVLTLAILGGLFLILVSLAIGLEQVKVTTMIVVAIVATVLIGLAAAAMAASAATTWQAWLEAESSA